jgi:serine/threonine protein kinase
MSFYEADDDFNSQGITQETPLSSTTAAATSRYDIHEQIGKGGMGVVFKATDTVHNKIVAIKKITVSSPQELNQAMLEIWPVRSLKHVHVVQYEHIYFERTSGVSDEYVLCIAMELFSSDLAKELSIRRSNSNNYFEQSELLKLMIQITEGVKYLHDNNIIHRDLKPLNLFIHNNNIVVGDLGLSKCIEHSRANTVTGTQRYMSPEVFQSSSTSGYDKFADIWSLGVCFLEMMLLSIDIVPYLEIYMNSKFYDDISKQLQTIGFSKKIISLVLKCLRLSVDSRPTASDLLIELNTLYFNKDSLNDSDEEDHVSDEFKRLYNIVTIKGENVELTRMNAAMELISKLAQMRQQSVDFYEVVAKRALFFDALRKVLLEGSCELDGAVALQMLFGYYQLAPDYSTSSSKIKYAYVDGDRHSILALALSHPSPTVVRETKSLIHTMKDFSYDDNTLISKLAEIEHGVR